MSKTTGQKLIGIEPNASTIVADIKMRIAELIDMVQPDLEVIATDESYLIRDEATRQLMTAQMWAVKAVTYKE